MPGIQPRTDRSMDPMVEGCAWMANRGPAEVSMPSLAAGSALDAAFEEDDPLEEQAAKVKAIRLTAAIL